MAQYFTRQPLRITLVWGLDELIIEDPDWIKKIIEGMKQDSASIKEDASKLCEPYSRHSERIDALMGHHARSDGDKCSQSQRGFKTPARKESVAAEALRVFLGLEMPVALNFKGWTGRSEHRMSAIDTTFWQSSRYWEWSSNLELQWVFIGYQIYASHEFGSPHYYPYGTSKDGRIERRLLSGHWIDWGFDCASSIPSEPRWPSTRRKFMLTPNGVQRIEQEASEDKTDAEREKPDGDDEPEFHEREDL